MTVRRFDEPLSKHTTFRIGGAADCFIEVENEREAEAAARGAKRDGAPFFVIGNGSNLLVSDAGFRGVALSLKRLDGIGLTARGTLMAGAGAALPKLAEFALDNGVAGLHWAARIPASVGGAVRNNCGAFGGDISLILSSVRVLDVSGGKAGTRELTAGECGFSYRKSVFCADRNLIITSAEFKAERADKDALSALYRDCAARRGAAQPKGLPNAGSVFKNPKTRPAGELIEKAGLKGLKIGGASVSVKHANFLENVGGATAADVRGLIKIIKEKVYSAFGEVLEEEIEYIGFN